MASCQCRLGGCVRGAGEMFLETPSPPASYGLRHPWGDSWVGAFPLCHGFALEVVSNQPGQHALNVAILPNLRRAAPSTVTPEGPGLCPPELATSLSCWARHSHPTSSSLLPAPGAASPAGCCAPQGAPPARWREGCSPLSRGCTGSCGRLILGQISFIRGKLKKKKKKTQKTPTYIAPCKFDYQKTLY